MVSITLEERHALETILAIRVVKSIKPGETLQDALVRFQSDTVLKQAGLPVRGVIATKTKAQLTAVSQASDQKSNEIKLLKHQIYQLQQDAIPSSGSDPCTGSGQSSSAEGHSVGTKKGKKRPADEDSQLVGRTQTKRAKKQKIPTEPMLTLFRPLDGPVRASLQRAEKMLQDGGATKASLDIIWSLRQLQQLSHTGGHAGPAFSSDTSILEAHIAVILSELHTAFARVLPTAGSSNSSIGTQKETFTNLSNLYIATLDLVARLLDDLPAAEKGAYFEKIVRLVVLKISDLLQLLLRSLEFLSPTAVQDDGRPSVIAVAPTPPSTDSDKTDKDVRPSLVNDIAMLLRALTALEAFRPTSRFFSSVQLPILHVLQIFAIREMAKMLDAMMSKQAREGPIGTVEDDEATQHSEVVLAGAVEPTSYDKQALIQLADLYLTTSKTIDFDESRSTRAQGSPLSTSESLLTQAERRETYLLLPRIFGYDQAGKLEAALGEEVSEIVVRCALQISLLAGGDVCEAMLDAMKL